LRHVQRGLVVHVLVQQRQAEEVALDVAFGSCREQVQAAVQLGLQFGPRGLGIGQRQRPAAVVRHAAAVVQRIGVRAQRRQARLFRVGAGAGRVRREARQPVFLEPADVSQLPQRRVQLGAQRHGQSGQRGFVGGKGGQRVGAAGLQRGGQCGGAAAARGLGRRAGRRIV